ncbi:MAG: SDR family oxidoreductase [Oscillospiraceae bacterium]
MIKTLVITGGTRGIGRETAMLFAKNGYDIVFGYHKSEEEAKSLMTEYPCCYGIKADFNNEDEVNAFCEKALKRLSHIDVIINNAGISEYSLLTKTSSQSWDKIMNVNLKSMFLVCRALLPSMISRQGGEIINISSMWGITGGSCEVPYSASKGGVIAFTKALAKEVGPSGIRVNSIAPGVIVTDMLSSLGQDTMEELKSESPINQLGTPLDVARAAWFLSENNFITGQILSVDGGITI